MWLIIKLIIKTVDKKVGMRKYCKLQDVLDKKRNIESKRNTTNFLLQYLIFSMPGLWTMVPWQVQGPL